MKDTVEDLLQACTSLHCAHSSKRKEFQEVYASSVEDNLIKAITFIQMWVKDRVIVKAHKALKSIVSDFDNDDIKTFIDDSKPKLVELSFSLVLVQKIIEHEGFKLAKGDAVSLKRQGVMIWA